MKSEINLADNYRKSVIVVLSRLSMHLKYIKSFEDITREDLLSFLDSFRKSETLDPLHRWIGTYNLFRTHLMMPSSTNLFSIFSTSNNDISNPFLFREMKICSVFADISYNYDV